MPYQAKGKGSICVVRNCAISVKNCRQCPLAKVSVMKRTTQDGFIVGATVYIVRQCLYYKHNRDPRFSIKEL